MSELSTTQRAVFKSRESKSVRFLMLSSTRWVFSQGLTLKEHVEWKLKRDLLFSGESYYSHTKEEGECEGCIVVRK